MGAFIEKFNGANNRKIMGRQFDRAGVFDIPAQLHVLKSESLDLLELTDFSDQDNSILTESGDLIILEQNLHDNLVTEE